MTSEIQLFRSGDMQVRTIVDDSNEPWFCANDVAKILGLSHPREYLSNVKDTWKKGVRNSDTPGGKQTMTFINEPAVYKLAFRSRKPEAERFTDWLAVEVLPSLRRYGKYEIQPAKDNELEYLRKITDLQEQLLAEKDYRLESKQQKIPRRPKNTPLTRKEMQKIVSMAQIHPELTRAELGRRVGRSTSSVRKALREYKAMQGRIS